MVQALAGTKRLTSCTNTDGWYPTNAMGKLREKFRQVMIMVVCSYYSPYPSYTPYPPTPGIPPTLDIPPTPIPLIYPLPPHTSIYIPSDILKCIRSCTLYSPMYPLFYSQSYIVCSPLVPPAPPIYISPLPPPSHLDVPLTSGGGDDSC